MSTEVNCGLQLRTRLGQLFDPTPRESPPPLFPRHRFASNRLPHFLPYLGESKNMMRFRNGGAFDSAKNHKRQRRKRQSS